LLIRANPHVCGNETEAITARVAVIKDQLEAEEVLQFAEKLKDRVAKLEGKIAIFKIGAPTDTSKEGNRISYRRCYQLNTSRAREGIVPVVV